MKDEITIIEVLIFTAVLIVLGFFSALRSAESMEEEKGKYQSQFTWFARITFNAIMGLTFKVMPPIVYAIILVLIALLQLINTEGKKRRQSWNILAVGYVFILIVSLVYNRGDSFSPLVLLWLIPILAPFITGIIQTARLNKKERKTETQLSGRVIMWAAIAVLTIAVVVLSVLVITRR